MAERARGARRPSRRAGGRRRWLWRWLPALAWAALLIVASSIPDVGDRLPSALRFPGSDLVAHFFVYGVLGALLARATGRWWPALLLASAFGALDELYQGTVPGRQPSAVDWVADTLGAALGAAVVVLSTRRTRGSG
jgi:VanZ family protein